MNNNLSAEKIAALQHEFTLEEARRTMLGFTEYTFPQFEPNWHHRILCDALDQVERGHIKKLIVMMPPRHGKSELVSRRFPAYCLGRNPDRKIMGCSHSQDLARDMSKDVQTIIRSPEYEELFSTRLGGRESVVRWDAATVDSLDNRTPPPRGGYKAASTGTGIAGYGFNIGIIDDYVGKWQDIEGAKFLDTLWKWYINDFSTRKTAPWCMVVMATPWHPDDLIHRILNGPDAEEWTVVRLPYIAEEEPEPYDPREPGEILWPGRMFVGDPDPPELEIQAAEARRDYEIAKTADPVGAAALLDCRPRANFGLLLDADDMLTFEADPSVVLEGADGIFVSVDSTFKSTESSDRVGILVGARHDQRMYIVDGEASRLNFSETKERLREYAEKYPSAVFIIEDKANGPALIAELEAELPAVIAYNPKDSKTARAQVAAARTKRGTVFWPMVKYLPNVEQLKDEIVRFGEARYDDVMDAYSQLLLASVKKKKGIDRLRQMAGGLLRFQ